MEDLVVIGSYLENYEAEQVKGLLEAKEYYENGIMRSLTQYKGGKLDGVSKFFYLNGQSKSNDHYSEGILIKREDYDEEGKLIVETR